MGTASSMSDLNPQQFTNTVKKIINDAGDLAKREGNPTIAPLHMAYVMFSDPSSIAVQAATRLSVSTDANSPLLASLSSAISSLTSQSPAPPNPSLSSLAVEALQAARESITATVRGEFEKGKTELSRMDIDAIQARLRAGKKKLRVLQSRHVTSASSYTLPTPPI